MQLFFTAKPTGEGTGMGLSPSSNNNLKLITLAANDFNPLYQVAAGPAIWAQHPNKDRRQITIFRIFFEGALQIIQEITIFTLFRRQSCFT